MADERQNKREEDEKSKLQQKIRQALKRKGVVSIAKIESIPEEKRYDTLYPVSTIQNRFLFGNVRDQLLDSFYVQLGVFCIVGKIDLSKILSAIAAFLKEQDLLRTRYLVSDGAFKQIVKRYDAKCLDAFVQVSAEASNWKDLERIAEEFLVKEVDLLNEYSVKWLVVHGPDGAWHLCYRIHHIAYDEKSNRILARRFFRQLDQSERQDSQISLQYLDYAVWENIWLDEKRRAMARGAWLEQFGRREIKTDLSSMSNSRNELFYSEITFWYDEHESEQLKQFVRLKHVTLQTFAFVSLSILLKNLFGINSLCIGYVVSNRTKKELEDTVGCFVNTLALPISMGCQTQVGDLWRSVDDGLNVLREYSEVPYDELLRTVFPGVDTGFNVQVGVEQIEEDASVLYQDDAVVAKPDDALKNVIQRIKTKRDQLDREPNIYVQYNLNVHGRVGIFAKVVSGLAERDAEDISRRIRVVNTQLLGNGLSADAFFRRVDELSVLSQEEEKTILYRWNDTKSQYPTGRCVHELFRNQVSIQIDRVAVEYDGEHITYKELNTRVNQLGCYLRECGVEPEQLAGVCMERSIELVITLLGVMTAGGAYVPIDPGYPEDRIRYMVANSAAKVVITQRKHGGHFNGKGVMLEEVWEEIAKRPSVEVKSGVRPENLAYVIYTSGSTGKPKGAMNAHRGVVNRLAWMQEAFRLVRDDVVLQKTPYSFDVSVWEFFWPLTEGAKIVEAIPGGHRDAVYLKDVITRERVSTLHFVPSMMGLFMEVEGVEALELRQVMVSGEALSVAHRKRFYETVGHLGAELHNLYGPTEAAVDVTWWACLPNYNGDSEPIGKPIANVWMYIVERALNLLPVGVSGEVCIGGIQVGRGYWNRPELTAEKFVPDPWSKEAGVRMYRTGDLGRWLSDGNIEYAGRMDHQVKVRGYRIELGEIENALRRCSGVKDAVLIVKGEGGEKRLVAFTVGEGLDISSIREYLTGVLPDYMIPSVIEVIDAMPLTPNGKLDRVALEHREISVYTSGIGHRPRDFIETTLQLVWKSVLGRTPSSLDEDFFSSGGNSLLALKLMLSLNQKFGDILTVVDVFQNPQLGSLARLIRERVERFSGDTSEMMSKFTIVPLKIETHAEFSLFIVHPLGGTAQPYLDLANALPDSISVYGIQAPSLLTDRIQPSRSIAEMAETYAAAIQASQFQGKLLLAGWSAGALIVYEVAIILGAREINSFKAIWIDGPWGALAPAEHGATPTMAERLMGVHDLACGAHNFTNSIDRDEFFKMAYSDQIECIATEWRKNGVMAEDVSSGIVRRYVNFHEAVDFALSHYAYKPMKNLGNILFVGSASSLPDKQRQDEWLSFWRSLIGDDLRHQTLDCQHLELVKPPYVQQLAQVIVDFVNAPGTTV